MVLPRFQSYYSYSSHLSPSNHSFSSLTPKWKNCSVVQLSRNSLSPSLGSPPPIPSSVFESIFCCRMVHSQNSSIFPLAKIGALNDQSQSHQLSVCLLSTSLSVRGDREWKEKNFCTTSELYESMTRGQASRQAAATNNYSYQHQVVVRPPPSVQRRSSVSYTHLTLPTIYSV